MGGFFYGGGGKGYVGPHSQIIGGPAPLPHSPPPSSYAYAAAEVWDTNSDSSEESDIESDLMKKNQCVKILQELIKAYPKHQKERKTKTF